MDNDIFNFYIDHLDPDFKEGASVHEEALREYWAITSFQPLKFKYTVKELIEKWSEEVLGVIKENYLISARSTSLICPICEKPISFSTRGKLQRLLAEKNSIVSYCISNDHDANLNKKFTDAVNAISSFRVSEYLGQTNWDILKASPDDLLKLMAIYLENGPLEKTISIRRKLGTTKGLLPYTESLLPDLVRKGYAIYVKENTPYPKQVLEAMDFINKYIPTNWKPKHFYEDYSIRLSRLKFKDLASGYRLNESNLHSEHNIDLCLELIMPHAYDNDFLNVVEEMLLESRAHWLLILSKSIGDDFGIPIRFSGSSDLIMKSLAHTLPIKAAIELINIAARKSSSFCKKPGVAKEMKSRFFFSSLNKLLEKWEACEEIDSSEEYESASSNECGLDTAIHLIYIPQFDMNEMSVNQIMKQLYQNVS